MKKEYSVKDVLKLLNICRNTLYMWELKGKIKSTRNPHNRYRIYSRKELLKFVDLDKLEEN